MAVRLYYRVSAEREGFEPPEVLPSTVFKTAAIDRSAISPFSGGKNNIFSETFGQEIFMS